MIPFIRKQRFCTKFLIDIGVKPSLETATKSSFLLIALLINELDAHFCLSHYLNPQVHPFQTITPKFFIYGESLKCEKP